ncbi:hypothetical protein [Streptomyces sp. NPDC001415]
MTRPALALIVTHVVAAAILGSLAADAADHARHDTAALLLLAALCAYVAAVREFIHAGTIRRLLRDAPPHSGPIDMSDAVLAVARAGECREAWWPSCGRAHTSDCRTQEGSEP